MVIPYIYITFLGQNARKHIFFYRTANLKSKRVCQFNFYVPFFLLSLFQGFSCGPVGDHTNESWLRATGTLHCGGAVFRPGEGEDHEGAGDQRDDGQTQTGARWKRHHHHLCELHCISAISHSQRSHLVEELVGFNCPISIQLEEANRTLTNDVANLANEKEELNNKLKEAQDCKWQNMLTSMYII